MEKVTQELNKLFAEPLREFYNRRVVFWIDEDKEYIDKVETLELANAKVVVLSDRNQFAVKKLIEHDDPNSNLLIYTSVTHSDPDSDWLLNVKLYGEEYRSDLLSQWLQEMGIENEQSIRETVRNYSSFFKPKGHRSKVANLSRSISTPGQVHLAVLAILCGQKDINPQVIIRTVLRAGLTDENELYKGICKYNADAAFWKVAAQVTGYIAESHDLGQLAAHILITATAQTLPTDYLLGLEDYISNSYKAHCHDLVSAWMLSNDVSDLGNIATLVENEFCLATRFMKLNIDDIIDIECFPCVDEIVLTKLLSEIGDDHIINVEMIQSATERRRTSPWYAEYADYYNGVLQVANMQEFFTVHSSGFHTMEPNKVWKEYTSDYYVMDTYYRQFHNAYSKIKLTAHPELEELFKKVVTKVEGLYTGWFLGSLGENWTKACEADMAQYGCVPSVEQQTDFYRRKVRSGNAKTFVIISDALRYEVAAALARELETDNHAKVTLDSCEAIFPAVTKYGMAALLPHNELTVEMKNGTLDVLADGVSTNASYREKILQAANPNSVVIRYKDFADWGKQERAATTKGMDVIYIYHDVIDATGHNSENKVFQECQTAIDEIKKLVRDITNDCNGTRILITADHGFLYTYAPLKEDGKISKENFNGVTVECDRRYALLQKGGTAEYLMPVKFFKGETAYDGFAPKESIRIKTHGSQNYVHGGVSLQESVVPVITYHHVRTNGAEYRNNESKYKTEQVDIELLSSARKISNMIFTLDFYQKDPVGGNRSAGTYQIYFTDEFDVQVSDIQNVIADKENENIQDRQYHLTFNLKPLKFNQLKTYNLVIKNISGKKTLLKIPFQIDIAFAIDDFGLGIFG